jgi:hypothetical protein
MKLKLFLAISTILVCSACAKSDDINQAQLNSETKNIIINKKQCKQMQFLKNYSCSVNNIEHKATAGNADAAYALGYIYYYGIGVTENEQSAQLWIERAANLGQPAAIAAKQMLAQAQSSTNAVQPQQINNTKMVVQQQKNNSEMVVRHPQPINQTATMAKSNNGYVIQFAASKSKLSLAAIKNKYHINNSIIAARLVAGAQWYVLQQGNYSNSGTARSALHNYPAIVQNLKPWIRKG